MTSERFQSWLDSLPDEPFPRVAAIESFGSEYERELDPDQLAEMRALYAEAEPLISSPNDAADPGVPKY